jgi:glycosyltransferase 2 family protein
MDGDMEFTDRLRRLAGRIARARGLRLALSLLVCAALVWLALRGAHLGAAWLALRRARPGWLLASLALVFVYTALKIVRWQLLLGPAGKKVRLVDTGAAFLSGQLVDLAVMGHVGELTRSYLLGSRGPGGFYVLGTVLLEKTLDFGCFALLTGLALLVAPMPGWLKLEGIFFAAAAIGLAVGVLLAAYRPELVTRWIGWVLEKLPVRLRAYLQPRLERLVASLQVVRLGAPILAALLLSIVLWCMSVLENDLVLRTMGIHLELSASLLLLVAIQVGISVINTPGQIGVFEALGVLILGLYGVEPSLALGYSLLLHIVAISPLVPGGVISIGYFGQPLRAAMAGRLDETDQQPADPGRQQT